jgi:hypothetical protein
MRFILKNCENSTLCLPMIEFRYYKFLDILNFAFWCSESNFSKICIIETMYKLSDLNNWCLNNKTMTYDFVQQNKVTDNTE